MYKTSNEIRDVILTLRNQIVHLKDAGEVPSSIWPSEAAVKQLEAVLPLVASRESEIARLRKELEAARAHEKQTHTELGAILGADDSLEECARRAVLRAEAAEQREREALAMLLRCDDAARIVMDTLEGVVQYGSIYDCYDVSEEPETDDIVWQSYELERLLTRAREQENNSTIGGE